MKNLATILPLQSKLSGKFQRFSAIDASIKMLKVEFPKISIEMKNCETFSVAQTEGCLKEIIQPLPDKKFLRL